MLKVAGQEKHGYLDFKSIETFPCGDLRTIDRLWVKYSNGHFGFSVQKRIWESVGGKLGDYDYDIYCLLGVRVGWRVKDKWLDYSDLTFSLNASRGHLPSTTNFIDKWSHDLVVVNFGRMVLFSRVETCKV